MSRGRRKKREERASKQLVSEGTLRFKYRDACKLVADGRAAEGKDAFQLLERATGDTKLKALLRNDGGTLAFLDGDLARAKLRFTEALALDW
jgi:hypothetical protein